MCSLIELTLGTYKGEFANQVGYESQKKIKLLSQLQGKPSRGITCVHGLIIISVPFVGQNSNRVTATKL